MFDKINIERHKLITYEWFFLKEMSGYIYIYVATGSREVDYNTL